MMMKVINKIRNWFKGFKKEEELSENLDDSLTKDIFNEMGALFNTEKDPNKRMAGKFYQMLWRRGADLRMAGRQDGSIGQRPMELSVVKTLAEQTRDYVKAQVDGESEAIIIESERKEELKNFTFGTFEAIRNYKDSLNKRRQLFPRKYSAGLGWFYIIIALLLILADIPLALKLTQYGFALDTPPEGSDYVIKNLFLPPNEVGFFGYIVHFLLVLANNWEVFVLAFGIALCTIYIKIFYDDFMEYPLDKAVTQFKYFPNANEEDQQEIRKLYRKRAKAKISFLVLTLSTIILLGFFRSESFSGMNQQTSESENYSPAMEYTPGGSAESDPSATTGIAAFDEFQTPVKIATFIILTLLFPIIGGICASLGLSNIQNISELNRVIQELNKSREDYKNSVEAFTKIKQAEEKWKGYREWVNNDFVDKYTRFFVACYEHGYERGVIEPDSNLDIYERAKKLRDRLISTKTFEAVHKNNHGLSAYRYNYNKNETDAT